MTLDEIRRRPTLPGRFQPSTISVLRLNFCVRDGNRWIPQAIVTGKEQGSRPSLPRFLTPSVGFRLPDFLPALSLQASHPQNRTGRFRSAPSDHDLASLLALTFFASLLSNHFHGPRSRSQFPVSAFASPVPCSLSPVPFFQDQALDRLVSPSSIHYCTSTDDLSTLSSSRGLTCF